MKFLRNIGRGDEIVPQVVDIPNTVSALVGHLKAITFGAQTKHITLETTKCVVLDEGALPALVSAAGWDKAFSVVNDTFGLIGYVSEFPIFNTARILGDVPVSEIRVGDKFKAKNGSWGYIEEIYKGHMPDDDGDYIYLGPWQLKLRWAIGMKVPEKCRDTFLKDTLLYSTVSEIQQLEEETSYWIRRKFNDGHGEFLSIGVVSGVSKDGKTADVDFAGDETEARVIVGDKEDNLNVPLSSVLSKITFMG